MKIQEKSKFNMAVNEFRTQLRSKKTIYVMFTVLMIIALHTSSRTQKQSSGETSDNQWVTEVTLESEYNKISTSKQAFDLKASIMISIGFGASISIARKDQKMIQKENEILSKKVVDNTSIIVYNDTKYLRS